jgi:hypothetical protein
MNPNPTLYEHLQNTGYPTDLEIPEVTIGASLLTGPPLVRIYVGLAQQLNSEIPK